jgi:hypothetical protein
MLKRKAIRGKDNRKTRVYPLCGDEWKFKDTGDIAKLTGVFYSANGSDKDTVSYSLQGIQHTIKVSNLLKVATLVSRINSQRRVTAAYLFSKSALEGRINDRLYKH